MYIASKDFKRYRTEDFNYNFDMHTGYTEMWGKTKDDDPMGYPMPIICDMEITDICTGVNGTPCKFCYKSNTAVGSYMDFETAKKVIDKMPIELTQIAFGADATLTSNHEWLNIFKYAREKSFIPNVTVANIDEETAYNLANICGAVAVSRYENKNYCYDSVKLLTDNGLSQVNIHQLLSKETLPQVYETINDIKNDPRLKKLNAIVFLSLKNKGRGKSFNRISEFDFKNVIKECQKVGINYGFDSCSFHKWAECIDDKNMIQYGEPCESTLHSAYINVKGDFFPCSFTEGTYGWEQGLSVLECNDFITDIWNHPKTMIFRHNLISNKRKCPIYII